MLPVLLLLLLCRFRVLDEVDRMMQMGFIEDVEKILKAEEGRQVGSACCDAAQPALVSGSCASLQQKERKRREGKR